MQDEIRTAPAPEFKPLVETPSLEAGQTVDYILPRVRELAGELSRYRRILDVGCGNGGITSRLASASGADVVGIDLDEASIRLAQRAYPHVRFEVLAADEHVVERLGGTPFDLVVSTEVAEHLYSPQSLMSGCVAALRPGGRAIISVPYHGYLKNLLIALTGKCDGHYNPLWEGGHIKFFSTRTLRKLMTDAGLENLQFRGAGRMPGLWMSLVASGDKPTS